MKQRALQLLMVAALTASAGMAQSINCLSPAYQNKLVCGFPFLTGAYTNESALGSSAYQGSASQSAVQTASSIDSAMATQISQLPLVTASAGSVIIPKNGSFVTFDDLGPILTERPQTVGRGRVYLGFSASQYVFNNIDGQSLGSLNFSVAQAAYNASGGVISTTYTQQQIAMSLRVNQFVSLLTVGLSHRADVSVIVPVTRVSVSGYTTKSTNYVVSASGAFQAQGPTASASGTDLGVGDTVVNGKVILSTGERAMFSGGMMLRLPTGDKLNLLGSGAYGFTPYLVYAYLGKFSPHARVAYQWNTDTILNTPNGAQKPLPGGLQYDIGADWAAKKRLSVALDLLGNQFNNIPVLSAQSVTIPGLSQPILTNTSQNSSYSVNSVGTGAKWNPAKTLVISANLLTQINNVGLKARPTPLLGISYKF